MSSARHLVLYDDECRFCRAQVALIKKLDWFGCFQFLPRLDVRVTELVPEVQQIPQAICCVRQVVGRGMEMICGAKCIRFMAMRIPPLLPLGMVMWVPGMMLLAELVYQWIARNRFRLGRVDCANDCRR